MGASCPHIYLENRMFFKKNKKEQKLIEQISSLMKDKEELVEEVWDLKNEVKGLKMVKKAEEEDLRHKIRMKEEKNAIELEKEKVVLARAKDDEVLGIREEYRKKLEERLTKEVESIRGMYSEILARLPDVNATLRGKI